MIRQILLSRWGMRLLLAVVAYYVLTHFYAATLAYLVARFWWMLP